LFDLSYPAGWTTPLCRHEAGACSGARTTAGAVVGLACAGWRRPI